MVRHTLPDMIEKCRELVTVQFREDDRALLEFATSVFDPPTLSVGLPWECGSRWPISNVNMPSTTALGYSWRQRCLCWQTVDCTSSTVLARERSLSINVHMQNAHTLSQWHRTVTNVNIVLLARWGPAPRIKSTVNPVKVTKLAVPLFGHLQNCLLYVVGLCWGYQMLDCLGFIYNGCIIGLSDMLVVRLGLIWVWLEPTRVQLGIYSYPADCTDFVIIVMVVD